MKSKNYKRMVYIICGILFVLSFIPFYVMVINATRSSTDILHGFTMIPGDNIINNFMNFLNNSVMDPLRGLLNSAIIVIPATALMMYFSSLTAYVFAIYDFRFKKALFFVILISMMIPGQLISVGLYEVLFNIHLLNSYIPLILPSVAAGSSVFFIRQYIKQGLSMSLIESGRMDGLSEMNIFHAISLPVIRPAIFTMGIFHFIGTWNSYLTPLIILNDADMYPLPLMMAQLRGFAYEVDQGVQYFGIAFSLIPIFIVFVLFSKHIISGISDGSVKE